MRAESCRWERLRSRQNPNPERYDQTGHIEDLNVLPAALIERFAGDDADRLVALLRLIAPITGRNRHAGSPARTALGPLGWFDSCRDRAPGTEGSSLPAAAACQNFNISKLRIRPRQYAIHSMKGACRISTRFAYSMRRSSQGGAFAMLTSVLDRRKSERVATRTPAEIFFSQFAPLACIVTNVSDGGAKIQVRGEDVPDVFVLHFTETGRKRHCRVVWRQGAEIGVSFTDKMRVNFGRRIASR
jgi:hypothetical protein